MVRISGAPRNQGSLPRRLFVGLVYSLTQRRLGRVIMPVQVTAHHPKILWGYGQMEQSQMGRTKKSPSQNGWGSWGSGTIC
jgi:hypothetical protein